MTIIFWFTISLSVDAQSDVFRKINKKLSPTDGLPNRHINTTFIDNQNRIWFSVDNQLAKFAFGKISSRAIVPDFSNRGFNSIVQDATGNLWISESVEWYFPFNIVRTFIFNPINLTTISVDEYIGKKIGIHSILSDNQGNILIGTKDGKVLEFDAKQKKIILKYKLDTHPIKLLYAGRKGMVLCVEKSQKLDEKLIHLDNSGKIAKEILLKNSFIRTVVETDSDLLMLHQYYDITLIKSLYSSKQIAFKSVKDSYLWNLKYDKTFNLIILNSSNSLQFYDSNFKIVDREDFDFLIHDIFIDQSNNYFLSTNDGVHILNFSKKNILTFLKNKELDKINENYSCRAIVRLNKDEILVNTNKKRQLINTNTNTVRSLHEFKNISGDENRFVLSILKDKDGDLLFGEDGLVKTNLKTQKDEILCNLDTTKIWSIKAYKDGVLLGLERKGIIYYNKKTKKARVFTKLSEFFNNSIVYDFFVDGSKIYIAAENGFFELIDETKLQKYIFLADEKIQPSCFHVYKDTKVQQSLMIASSKGIWYFDLVSKIIRPFGKESDVLSKKFLSVYRSKNGVWASSEEGVWHFDEDGSLLKIYTEADGLTSNECNRLSHFQDENGILYFGGINGLNILNPLDFSKNIAKKYALKIDTIKVYSANKLKRILTDYSGTTIHLGRYEESIEFGLSYEDYKYECQKKYYYRTDKSINSDWQLLPERQLILDNIGQGSSNIEIKVVSCSDFLNAQIIKITIIRQPPIYQEWYFWVCALIFLGIVIWLATVFSNHQLKKRNELLQQKIDEQTLILRESLELKETILSILVHDVRYPVQSFYDITRKLEYLIKKQDFDRLFLLGKETEMKSRKVLWLIDELVYWVKSTNKNWQAAKEEKVLNLIITQIIESYREELTQKNLKIEIGQHRVLARIDASLLVIVLRNLIFNAIIHSAFDSTIEIIIQQNSVDKFLIRIINEVMEEVEIKDKGLGLGLSLLEPMLKKAEIYIENQKKDGMYIAEVMF
ncbi:hypothetical protein [Emticicia sp.]|uniref:hypothetical protein n=1 Tax=Emticicia sp. TaxID=1930953 RepID=UPI003BA845BE